MMAKTVYAGDIAAGKSSYQSQCAQCHGPTALGIANLGAPALAGQQAAYLERQLDHFRSGVRGTQDDYAKQMSVMITLIDNGEAQTNVVSYLASLPNTQTYQDQGQEQQEQADLNNGYKQYQANCGGCHGPQAEGNSSLNSPRLAGLDPAYLQRQYRHFLTAKRGVDKSDRLGRQMTMIANTMKEQNKIDDVIAYIGTLNGATTPRAAEQNRTKEVD